MTLTIKQQREILVKWIDTLKSIKDKQFKGFIGDSVHITHDYKTASVYGWLTAVPEAVDAGFHIVHQLQMNGEPVQSTTLNPVEIFERWSLVFSGINTSDRKQCIKALENFLHTSYK